MGLLDTLCKPLRDLLSESDDLQRADLIFVLAGHRGRKVHGARLFRDGWAPRLLMSTVNPPYIARVLKREVPESALQQARAARSIHEAASQPYPDTSEQRLCFASVDEKGWSVTPIPVTRLGTLTEIKALAHWLRDRPAIRSVLVASDAMHLRRLRVCCARLAPKDRSLRFVAVSREAADGTPLGGHPAREGPTDIALEFAKLALYEVLLALRGRRSEP